MSASSTGAYPEQPEGVPIENPQMFNAPTFNGADIKLFKNGNDITLMLSCAHPGIASVNGEDVIVATLRPLCIWNLSVQTLKDLSLILNVTIQEIEQNTGEIVTEFSRRSVKPSA